MTGYLAPLLLVLGVAASSATAQEACPWAGGVYHFSSHGISGDFTVNADCTEMVWSRLSEPETTALEKTRHGWKGSLSKADVELLENGHNLRVTGSGGAMRQSNAKRMN